MLGLFKEEKMQYRILTLAVLSAAVFFVCRIIYAGIVALPYPQEILEPSNVSLTNMFIEGNSPYSLESLESEVPAVNYDYPFFSSLVAAFVSKVFDCSAVTSHFAVSLACILISGFLGYVIVIKECKTTVTPTLAALLFMMCHWRFGYISAAPDDLGLLLFILTLYASSCRGLRYKPLWCAVGATLCFYTKQYFMFVAAPVFIYLFLYSKKEAFRFLIWLLGINTAVAVIITENWPIYWLRTFVFTYMGAGRGGGFKLSTLIGQVNYLVFSFAALFAIVVAAAFFSIRNIRQSGKKIHFNIGESDVFAVSVINSIIMMFPLFIIGRNDGALLSYFLQLWMPSITVVALLSLERMRSEDKEMFFVYVYAAVSAFIIYFGFVRLPLHILSDEERANWQKAYEYTTQYGKKGEIYYSRSLAYEGFDKGNGQWMCGHDGEVDVGTAEVVEALGMPESMVSFSARITEQNLEYRDKLRNKAENHEYALITFESGDDFTIFNEDNCSEMGYKCVDKLDLCLGLMNYEVNFYVVQGTEGKAND